jgi:tetratricopeptide (TPR) repeat protein
MALSQPALDELWDFADPATSLERIEAAIGGAVDVSDRAELQTQRARALGLLDRFDEADAALAEVDEVSPLVAARVTLERGRVRNSADDPEAAIALFQIAAELAEAAGSLFLQVDALHMLAIADQDQSQRWTESALGLLAATDDPRLQRWRVALHTNAGWTLFDAGRVAEARTRFQSAREAAERWGTPQQVAFADEAIAVCDAA